VYLEKRVIIKIIHTLCDYRKITVCSTNPGFVIPQTLNAGFVGTAFNGVWPAGIGERGDRRLIVGACSLANKGGEPIALEVGHGYNRSVDR
jgi:hypothetical protein